MTSIEKYSDRIFENIKPIIMLAKKVRENNKGTWRYYAGRFAHSKE